jgi:hypothetical protein
VFYLIDDSDRKAIIGRGACTIGSTFVWCWNLDAGKVALFGNTGLPPRDLHESDDRYDEPTRFGPSPKPGWQ